MRKRNKKAKMRGENVAVVQRSGARIPRTMSTKNGTVVSHTETYGTNVIGTSDFGLFSTWAIQPGLSTYSRGSPLGQWLPQIAQNFDTYEIESLKFKFRTACSTLTTGLVMFGYEPNPEGTVPSSYQELRNMYSVDGSAHANLSFDVSSRVKKRLLVRKGNVVNLPSYDAGKVYFATIGVNDNALVGFVDVEYRIKLTNPQSVLSSTEVVPINPGKPNPTELYTINTSSLANQNCATDCDAVFNAALASPYVKTGAVLSIVKITGNVAINDTVENGCKFVCPLRTDWRGIEIAKRGQYRLTWSGGLGYEDLKMFCFALFGKETTSGNVFTRAQYTVYSGIDGSGVALIQTPIYRHRGFTGTAVGDPNPGTEVWPVFTWEFDAPSDFYFIKIMAGVLTYNSVSTTTANINGYSGIGNTHMKLEYLGPLPAVV